MTFFVPNAGVTAASLVVLLSTEYMLRSLCLRDTCLDDDALYSFLGDSLEMLDVSNTMVSVQLVLTIFPIKDVNKLRVVLPFKFLQLKTHNVNLKLK